MASFSGVPLEGVSIRPVSAEQLSAAGHRIGIVGGTGGLGRALALFFAARGAKVTVVGQTFRDEGTPGLDFVKADLSLMAEARRVGAALPVEEMDTLILTQGIFSTPKRETTSEGIERDLAVSYLSRLEIVKAVAPRLGTRRAQSTGRPRLFVMGFPGTGQEGSVDDLNSEKVYKMTVAHMNTVAGNEALVLDAARKHPGLAVFGLNPGLIKTNIRANALGGNRSLRFKLVEALIGWMTMGPEAYAARLGPVLLAPELDAHTGIHFNAKGIAIRPSKVMTEDHVSRLISASEAVLARAPAAVAAGS
jgi:NAD(P)-dependent dehydrogenase (short-subunit alcohol dehydrogenase family)